MHVQLREHEAVRVQAMKHLSGQLVQADMPCSKAFVKS